jgi:hypothetical protein
MKYLIAQRGKKIQGALAERRPCEPQPKIISPDHGLLEHVGASYHFLKLVQLDEDFQY